MKKRKTLVQVVQIKIEIKDNKENRVKMIEEKKINKMMINKEELRNKMMIEVL